MQPHIIARQFGGLLIAFIVLSIPSLAIREARAEAEGARTYRITIENLTPARGGGASQVLSPPLVVVHSARFDLFRIGQPANQSVIDVAEDAITATGIAAYSADPEVARVTAEGSPLPPGQSQSFEITASGNANRLSLVSMLVNTNDAFTGINAIHLTGRRSEYLVRAYDADSEMNDQLRANIPGPCCGDTGRHGSDESGVITNHPGIVGGVGDLDPAIWGWPTSEPVARIVVEPIR